MKKIITITLISILSILIGFLLFILVPISRSNPKIKGKIRLPDLQEEVSVIIDDWGVPHIFAQNEKDLYFASGYMQAQERMWQMELTRRAGFGRLSEIFGKMALERDKFMRNMGFEEAALNDFENLSPKMRELIASYCNGINAWMDSRKLNWPIEFLVLRFRPEPWTPLDSLVVKEIMALMLCPDYKSEAVRGKLAESLGAEKALQILEEGIPSPPSESAMVSWQDMLAVPPFQGSNNWVVSGNRSESGKPLLANDPHLQITLPPIWYEMHVNCPGLNAVGVTLPGVPFIIIGHNPSVAWGITNSAADVQDLYMEKLDSSGNMYLDRGEWKPLFKKKQEIKIKGRRKPEEIEIRWTERGPIITPIVIESQTPLSLSWTIYEGGRTMEAFYLLNKARNWQEFSEALALFDVPSQNFVYADTEGNIGYYLSGKIPIRAAQAAVFPFPGWKEEGQWQGFIDEDKKPNLFNPEEGYIVTANNKIVPDGFPYYVSFDWDIPFRADRVRELLLQKEKHSIESFKIMQNDVYTKEGEAFLPVFKDVEETDDNAGEALRLLKDWDLRMSSGKEPALFEAFINIFHAEVFKDELGENFGDFDPSFRRKKAGILRLLSDPHSSWYDNTETPQVENREDIVRISLEQAHDKLEKKYGPPDDWDWMRFHSIRFRHSLGEVPLFRFLNRGPYPLDGHAYTIRASFPAFGTSSGSSYRQIIDLSDFKNSICVLTSGQSGCFLSRFYDDQIPLWLEGQYHPMLFFPDDIRASSAGTLKLVPQRKK
jgi:penicillin amidase